MYYKELTIEADIQAAIGWNRATKNQFDKIIKSKIDEFCKENKIKRTSISTITSPIAKITIKFKDKDHENQMELFDLFKDVYGTKETS